MSAGMPTSTAKSTKSKKSWWVIVAGTAAVLAVGGLASQFFLSKPGAAATEEAPGKATVNSPRKPVEQRSSTVATVGKFAITEETLAKECLTRYGKEVLEDLINRAIIQQACDAQSVQVTTEEVDAEIVKIAKKYNIDPVEWQRMLQAERNVTPQQYRESIIWPMLALRKLAEGNAQDELSEADVQKEFERLYGQRVKARMIVLDNLRRAKDCWEKCKQDPESFGDLAQEYSIDPDSRALGGSIPPIPRHTGNDNLEKEAFRLKENQISGVVEIPVKAGSQKDTTRYVILKCEGRTEQLIDNIEEVRSDIVDQLKERKVQESVAKVFEKIKEQTTVNNYMTRTQSGPDAQSVNPAAKHTPQNSKPGAIKQTSAEKAAGPSPANRPKTAQKP